MSCTETCNQCNKDYRVMFDTSFKPVEVCLCNENSVDIDIPTLISDIEKLEIERSDLESKLRLHRRNMVATLKVDGRYYRGEKLWKWTCFRRFAAKLPIHLWEGLVFNKFRGNSWLLERTGEIDDRPVKHIG